MAPAPEGVESTLQSPSGPIFRLAPGEVTLEELGRVRGDLALEHVSRMELAQELDHLVLGRSVVTEARGGDRMRDRWPGRRVQIPVDNFADEVIRQTFEIRIRSPSLRPRRAFHEDSVVER